MYELAIDVGSGVTKMCGAEGVAHFPSLSGPPTDGGMDLRADDNKTVSFKIRGEANASDGSSTLEEAHYAVGATAPKRVVPELLADTRSDDWCQSNEYMALLYAAIAECVEDRYRGKIRLCTGLPQALYDRHRAELIKRLIGSHCFKVDGVPYKITIRREDVFVMPQVMGLFLSQLTKDTSLQNQRVAVLDVGTYTSDWTIIENLGTVQWASGGMAVGVSNVIHRIRDYLGSDHGADCSYVAVSDAIRKGHITLKGRKVELSDHIQQAVSEVAEPMIKEVKSQWRGASDAQVIVGGGGAHLFGPEVRTQFTHAGEVDKDVSIFAVVEGYYSYLTAFRRKPKAA